MINPSVSELSSITPQIATDEPCPVCNYEEGRSAADKFEHEEHHPIDCGRECCADGPDFEKWNEENTDEEKDAWIAAYRSGK